VFAVGQDCVGEHRASVRGENTRWVCNSDPLCRLRR
jgi:hypothetical protein